MNLLCLVLFSWLFIVHPQDFKAYLRSGMALGALIQTYSYVSLFCTSDHQILFSLLQVRWHVIWCINQDIVRPLLRAAYEVILLHSSRIWYKVVSLTWGSNRGTSECEPSTLPLDHVSYLVMILFSIEHWHNVYNSYGN